MPDSRTDLLRRPPAPSRWPIVVLVLVVLTGLVTVLASGWRVHTTTTAAPTPLTYTVATARDGVVEQSIPVRAELQWGTALVARNLLAGTVTSVAVDHVEEVSVGDVIYSVDLHPVFVAAGSTPAFRDLADGVAGPDVRQLQEMLVAEGQYTSVVDGIFGRSTASAVERWQKANGEEVTGVVAAGRVQFVPRLPALLAADTDEITVGTQLTGGESAVLESNSDPDIEGPLPPDLLPSVHEGAAVTIEAGTARWTGVVQSVDLREDGVGSAVFGQVDGTSCGEACPFLPGVDGALHARGAIVVVPRTEGTFIPVAAVRSDGDAQYVVDADGGRHGVTVTASANGLAVVEGVAPGDRFRVSRAPA